MDGSIRERVQTHKTFAHFGPGDVEFHDDDNTFSDPTVRTWRSWVKPLVVKQWLHRGKIYRERRERIPSRFELFFDLVFVAIAHQLSDTAAERADAAGFVHFVLTFFPSWSLWSETRAFLNASGTDDILQRISILYMMALLVGYTANATAITLGRPVEDAAHVKESFVIGLIGAILPEEASTGAGHSGRDPALVATTVFYLLGRGLRMAALFVYAMVLPRFRTALLFQFFQQAVLFVLYIPLLVTSSVPVVVTLATLGMALDTVMRYLIGFYRLLFPDKHPDSPAVPEEKGKETTDLEEDGRDCIPCSDGCAFERKRATTAKPDHAVPALNIEHFLERTAAFVVIVLGEMVLSVVYHATGSQVGVRPIYANAICGLVIAFCLCWLYFDSECSQRFLHAIRRHWFTSLTFSALHFPLCASLILVSAAMLRITQHEEEVPSAIRWFFGGGLGCAMLCLAAIGFTHQGLDPPGSILLGREVQLGVRTAVGIIMTCLPLATSLNPLEFMITCAGLTVFLVIEETIGKLHREGIQSKRKVENSKPMHDYDENLEGQKSETNRPVPEEKDKDQ